MSRYNPDLLRFERLSGSARLGWTAVLGRTRLGATTDLREVIPVSAVTLADGYTIGDNGELSLDPATGTAQMSTRGAPTGLTLAVGDVVEVSYEHVILFGGKVTGVTTGLEADPTGGFTQQTTYKLASREATLMSAVESWDALPEETALTRLTRWFTVDTTAVSAAHVALLNTVMPAEDAGTATRLDLARAFSAATTLPLRMRSYLTGGASNVTVLDPGSVAPTIADAQDWAHAVDYESTARGKFTPSTVTVRADDTRLMGGQQSVAVTPDRLGRTFRLGRSRLGGSLFRSTGFLAGDTISVFGTVVPVARVTQSFGRHYSASLELKPTGGSSASATPSPGTGGDTTTPTPVINSSVNVTDHGAIPNGRTDAGAAINRAIAASASGAAIVFPGGTYIIETPILLRADRAYLAEGSVTLKQKPNTTMECLVKVDPSEPTPRRNIHWQGIGLDGDAMNPFFDGGQPESMNNVLQTNNTVYRADSGFTGNNGMVLEAVQFSNFYDLAIRHCGGTGLVIQGLPLTGQSGEDAFNMTTSTLHFTSPYIYACGKYGVFFADRSDDNHIDFGDIGATQYEGVYLIAGSNSLRNCTIWGSKQANGILIGAPTNQVIGCQIEGHAQHGIKIVEYGSYNYIASNKIYYNSTQAAGGYDGINIAGSASHPAAYNTLIGNYIYAGIGEFFATPADWVAMRHGIALEDYCHHTVVNSNAVDLAPAGARPDPTAVGVYGLKVGDTYNGMRFTDAAEDNARGSANPRGLVPGATWWRDDIGATYVYTGPSRDRIERVLTYKFDVDGFEFYQDGGVSTATIAMPYLRFDTNYTVTVAPGWNTTWWITNKATTGFTINFGTAPPDGGAPCDWSLLRHGDA
ncbi:glycosyl hydrolase family 28-related protein [Dactylosporangium siamense]|uniref:Pectate lyase superfamily protein domain-containing protein n=1 Tax=Dactylosporangium siamense TaxID=685454 RepID=A0A919PF11_9ACTN|nr:right-handed parallel beta-helix repeat-containing protein [Dactylosporangium siamense]GIG42982.1 hypothetical protein Dsi01nite_010230 [Dactylosporangium siamense]